MRAGIGNDRLVVCLSEYLPLRIVYRISSMSTIGKCFVYRIYRRILITQESSRKSCSLAGGFVPTRSRVGLVLVFAATRKEMALRSVFV